MSSHVVSTHSPEGSESDVWPVEVAGQSFRLFCSTGPLIESMLDDIASAEQRVWIESYIFADDDAGRAIAEALMARARAGVEIHFLYDGWGSLWIPQSLIDKLIAAGVRVRAFHPLDEIVVHPNFFTLINRRNHRKLLVIDDDIAYFGGMNIVDTAGVHTVEEARERHLPASAGWRDVHARVVGPMATDIAAAHVRLWRRLHRRKVRWPRWPLEKMLRAPGEGVYLFDCLPSKKSRHARRVLCPLIRRAKSTITLSMAYFLPMGPVLRELLRARKRGVKVRVIVPGCSDVPLVQWATRHFYAWLMKRGIAIYERRDMMLHSKVMVIDDDWTVIGSCNLDPRSLQLNLELIGVIRGRAMAATVGQICTNEMRQSRRVTMADWRSRSWWHRLRDRWAWSLRRWL